MSTADKDIRYAITAEDRFARTFANLRRDIADTSGRFDSLTAGASRFAGALAVVGGGGLIGRQFRQLVDDLDALNDAADATGASVEKLSGLEDIARRNGAGLDLVTTGVLKLNQALAEAKPDSPISIALKAIGLNATELRRLDPADALQTVAQALARFESDGNKARLTQELFGKSTREVAALLKDLADAGHVNATVTAQQTAEAERFNKQLAAISTNASNASRTLVSSLLPALGEDLARLRSGQEVFGGIAPAMLAMARAGGLMSDAGAGVARYTAELERLRKVRADFERNDMKRPSFAVIGGLKEIDTEMAKVEKLQAFYRRVFAMTAPDLGQSDPRELARRGRGPGLASLPDITDTKPKVTDADRYLETLRKQTQSVYELTTVEKVLDDIRNGDLKGASAAQKDRALAIAREIDATKEAVRIAGERIELRKRDTDAANEAAEANAAADRTRLSGLLANTQVGALAEVRKDVDLLNSAYERGVIDAEQWAQAIIGSTDKLRRDVDQKVEDLSEFAREASRNIQDALGDSVYAALSGNFSRIESLWGDLIKRLIAQAASAQLAETLFGKGFGSSTSKVGGLVGDFFGWIGGFGGASTSRANGGPVRAGQLVRWQENGEEWFSPNTDGQVRTRAQMAAAAAGTGTTVFAPVYHLYGPVPQETVAQMRAVAAEMLARYDRSRYTQGAT